ncbi:MAG: helix-turn-helix domain-containing protein [bacterium]|nr:helix-turn-helix domain-containing protein [bacterium]
MAQKNEFLSIGEAARYLGVSITTLRRWHKAGSFPATFVSPGKRLYYSNTDLKRKTKGLVKVALDWASPESSENLPSEWHCPTSDVFKARLERFTRELLARESTMDFASLIASATGEIGNNSYDHNLGNWPDTSGVFFAYDLTKPTVVLADRGVGILATLQRVRPKLATHTEALEVAFTEIITGRAPEHRGNGLKYVRRAIGESRASLQFWTGNARLNITAKHAVPGIVELDSYVRGCVAVINF